MGRADEEAATKECRYRRVDQLARYRRGKGQCGFQNKYEYGLRARVEAQFSCIKRCLGDTLLTRRMASQVQEGPVIANLINQWNAFGRAQCVKSPSCVRNHPRLPSRAKEMKGVGVDRTVAPKFRPCCERTRQGLSA